MKSFKDHPFQLAAGANQGPDDEFGCLMNVVSWMNGDTRITDTPDCTNYDLGWLCVAFNDAVLIRFGVPGRRIDAGPHYPLISANVATPEQAMRMTKIASLVMDTSLVTLDMSCDWLEGVVGGLWARDKNAYIDALVADAKTFDQAVDRFMVEVVNSFRTEFAQELGLKESSNV